jgi:parallel beta-helix repeat protein
VKQRLWFSLLALVLTVGLMAWLAPTAHGSGVRAPATIRSVAPPPTGLNIGDCSVAPCATIGYAISKSSYGDRINVASGIYTEHITMTNGVSVYGTGWAVTQTVINGNFSANQPTVYFPTGIDATTVLSGIQVTHGGTGNPNASSNGSGIRTYYASPQIINTWVYSCTAGDGGGVNVEGGTPTFNNVPVWSSRAMNGGGFYIQSSPLVTLTSDMNGTNGTVLYNYAGVGGGFYMASVTATLSGLRVGWNVSNFDGGMYIGPTPGLIKLLQNDISFNSSANVGGIEVNGVPSLQIVSNTISTNTAGVRAGGIVFVGSAGLFQRNLLMGNSVTMPGYSGGGATVNFTSTLTMDGNRFEGNSATLSGGGLQIDDGSVVDLNANTIVSNTANYGGGIYLSSQGLLTVTNNIIARNIAPLGGAGVYAQNTIPLVIGNNTIANNTGTGITFNAAGGIQLYNNIVYGNTGAGLIRLDSSSYFSDYNDVGSNSPNYSSVAIGPHDLSTDPLFIGSGAMFNYYHIQPTSPVSKTGLLISPPLYDIDGERRLLCMSMGADQICTKNLFLPLILK